MKALNLLLIAISLASMLTAFDLILKYTHELTHDELVDSVQNITSNNSKHLDKDVKMLGRRPW